MKLPVKVKSIDLQVAGQAINTNAGRWEDFSHVYSGDYDYLQRHADGLNARADYRGIVVQALVHLEGITIVSDEDLRTLRSAYWSYYENDRTELIERVQAQCDQAIEALRQLREMVDD